MRRFIAPGIVAKIDFVVNPTKGNFSEISQRMHLMPSSLQIEVPNFFCTHQYGLLPPPKGKVFDPDI